MDNKSFFDKNAVFTITNTKIDNKTFYWIKNKKTNKKVLFRVMREEIYVKRNFYVRRNFSLKKFRSKKNFFDHKKKFRSKKNFKHKKATVIKNKKMAMDIIHKYETKSDDGHDHPITKFKI